MRQTMNTAKANQEYPFFLKKAGIKAPIEFLRFGRAMSGIKKYSSMLDNSKNYVLIELNHNFLNLQRN